DFAEVTARVGDHVVRTRYHTDKGNWFVTSRGDEGGIVSQSMTAPAAFALPATPTLGWLLYAPKHDALNAYVIDAGSPDAGEKLETLHIREAGRKVVVSGDRNVTFSVGAELNLPAVVELPDGSRRTYQPAAH